MYEAGVYAHYTETYAPSKTARQQVTAVLRTHKLQAPPSKMFSSGHLAPGICARLALGTAEVTLYTVSYM